MRVMLSNLVAWTEGTVGIDDEGNEKTVAMSCFVDVLVGFFIKSISEGFCFCAVVPVSLALGGCG